MEKLRFTKNRVFPKKESDLSFLYPAENFALLLS